ncbi:MAG: hypothetical protein QMB37_00260 [Paludibacteraceae bacterium]|nr:hypothetical protein [Bacteroidia bacterium]HRG02538.1 hypothetical protein [Paludibacteraceae bacterium]
MNSTIKLIIYAISTFLVFLLLTWILRLMAGKLPIENGILGVFKNSDLLLGLVVAVAVTFSHIQKRKLK